MHIKYEIKKKIQRLKISMLPCGVQFIGSYGDEATLFRLAAQLERVKPWFYKQPRGIAL